MLRDASTSKKFCPPIILGGGEMMKKNEENNYECTDCGLKVAFTLSAPCGCGGKWRFIVRGEN